ncbi:MAG TPA: hypothetical protein VM324_07805 [Egibacteraceae bacterium]|jgi:hypothetical protein|nr:hypothetical protein [Egibacteraceae bacterium]
MSDAPRNEEDVEELRDAARELGVDRTEDKDADDLLEAAQRAQGDSTSSPTNPDWQKDGPRDDVAGA